MVYKICVTVVICMLCTSIVTYLNLHREGCGIRTIAPPSVDLKC